jgi:hypothetical protein
MISTWQDVRYGMRTLLKRPAFTTIAVATIALGIGANTSIFSVMNGVLLEPLPLRDPAHLVTPNVISPRGFEISLSIPNFKDWRERSRSFASFGANMSRNMTLTGIDRPAVIRARLVLGDYFETLGVPAIRGRVIPSDETWAGAAPIAVVTHGFWERRLGGAPDVIGRTITLDSETFEIIGVMPREFVFPSADTEVFLPMGHISENLCWEVRGCSQGTWAIARLKDGVDLMTAQADLDRVHREIEAEEGEEVARPETSPPCCSHAARADAASWRCGRRSAPAGAAWSSSCSPRVWYSGSPAARSASDWRTRGRACSCRWSATASRRSWLVTSAWTGPYSCSRFSCRWVQACCSGLHPRCGPPPRLWSAS